MREGFYSGATRTAGAWKPPVGSALFAHKHGSILPMEEQRKGLLEWFLGRLG